MTKAQFIARIAPYAVADMRQTDIAASLTIAQAALESAWGGSGLTKQANNLFGIKGNGTAGSCTMPTTEYVNGRPIKVNAAFRAYHNWGESILDHSKLILNGVSWNRNLYKGVIGKRGADAARAIATAGYATDPKYAEKLISIMNEWNLYQYDESGSAPVKEDDEAMKEELAKLTKRVDVLEKAAEKIPAPKWFVEEFGSDNLGGKISDPEFTLGEWRTLAVGLRVGKK
ncbi:glycoside hydrolase family 73 protein [Paenibacillus brevis]|uniref:Glycoside hydrolase family 73 protein n=1 Tax=Paenibacillus brevis TaxID=2841508 RepID=A0ABS6FJ85_9BACL|nr:glycoside hydrolase family 73 protein [Paenibacillus brevis]MBU5670238.1 glycoside hydrolase family 73 protein [Paenibacillus brevis]